MDKNWNATSFGPGTRLLFVGGDAAFAERVRLASEGRLHCEHAADLATAERLIHVGGVDFLVLFHDASSSLEAPSILRFARHVPWLPVVALLNGDGDSTPPEEFSTYFHDWIGTQELQLPLLRRVLRNAREKHNLQMRLHRMQTYCGDFPRGGEETPGNSAVLPPKPRGMGASGNGGVLAKNDLTVQAFKLLDLLELGMVRIGTDKRIQSANAALMHMFQTPQDQLLGRLCHEAFAGSPHVCDACPGERCLEDIRRTEAEIAFHPSECSPLHVRCTCVPLLEEGGQASSFVGVFKDITRRKGVELGLQADNGRGKLGMEVTQDGLFDWNVATGEVYYSPRYCHMLGYEPGELEPNVSVWKRLHHPEDLPHSIKELERHFRENSIFEIEFRMRTKSGAWKWILGRGRVIERAADGTPLRMVGTHVDLDPRKQAEAALRASEERFRVIFESAGMGIALLNKSGFILDCNAAYAKMLGYERRRIVGHTFSEFTHPDDKKRDRARFLGVFKGVYDFYKLEKRYLRSDGSILWGVLRATMVRGQEDEHPFVIAMFEDTSEMKRGEEQLRAAKEAAEAASKAKSEFLANMSHEIRTPLNGVLGLLQLLEETPLNDEQQEYVSTALLSGKSLLTVINDILDFSKIEAGKIEICEEAFDPRELVRTVEEAFRHRPGPRGYGSPAWWNLPCRTCCPETAAGLGRCFLISWATPSSLPTRGGWT